MNLAYEFFSKNINIDIKNVIIEPLTYLIEVSEKDELHLKFYQRKNERLRLLIQTDNERNIYISCSAMDRILVFRNGIDESEHHYDLFDI